MLNTLSNPSSFIKAGKAIFTVLNEKTGGRFTFKVNKAKDKELYFVSVLTGSNNDSDYAYMGIINAGKFSRTAKSKITKEATSFKAFDYTWNHLNILPENVKIFHEGRCGRCGRTLTVPESIESGFGPECMKRA